MPRSVVGDRARHNAGWVGMAGDGHGDEVERDGRTATRCGDGARQSRDFFIRETGDRPRS
jgi:hypothetical protein